MPAVTYYRDEPNMYVRNAVALEGNIKVTAAAAAPASTDVMVLGTKKTLSDAAFIASLPQAIQSHAALYNHAVSKTSDKSTTTYFVPAADSAAAPVQVTVGVVPETATRNLCPTRPDVITSLIRGSKIPTATAPVIYAACGPAPGSRATKYLSVVTAVAKSFSFFSAKKFADTYVSTSVPKSVPLVLVDVGATAADGAKDVIKPEALNVAAYCCQLCMFLIDAPPCLLDTTSFTEIVEGLSKKHGFTLAEKKVGDDLYKAGLHGIYNVGKAAAEAPAMLVCEHKGNAADAEPAVLVGKGIIYDTGGLAIKPAANMCAMKADMGGAAATFCGFLASVLGKAEQRTMSVLCLAENAVGPHSYRNDDIVRLHCGLTVEINNTDAEGRVVLADGISWATKNYKPKVVVNMATLTGAQAVATGIYHAGIYTNSDEYEAKVKEAGLLSGDLCFPFVYAPEFLDEQFSSKVADLKNSVKNRTNAGSACAGRFLERTLASEYTGPFVHLDIAAPAFQNDQATGYGPGLLCALLFNKHF